MKHLFPGFYADTPDDIDLDVAQTSVAFDANVLLNLYRYPSNASEDLLRVMHSIGNKVWLPHQAALEYFRNRLTVISDQNRKFRDVRRILQKTFDSLEKELADLQLKKRHSMIDPANFMERLRAEMNSFESQLSAQESTHQNVNNDDPVRNRLMSIFSNRVGDAPVDQDWLDKLFGDGAKRYGNNIPPGYRDLPKQGESFTHKGLQYKREYGDLILWRQIIAHCQAAEIKQLIFVTDDDKEDWWLIVDSGGKRRLGPRPELIEELKGSTVVEKFCLLNSDQFAQRFSKMLGLEIAAATVQQVRDVRSTLSTQERVKCPSCGLVGTESLGAHPGSSAFHVCDGCSIRFHVHRTGDGQIITRETGSATKIEPPARFRVEAVCPKCQNRVPANLNQDEQTTDRYCMNCCTLLKIGANGLVVESHSSHPVRAAAVTYEGKYAFLSCPKCPNAEAARTIWRNDLLMRSVCYECHTLIEANVSNEG